MSQRIHHLDSLTVDQIAAGEVIDVPASCVKELVENSLDAGATDIVAEVSLGGRELIRVTDNGCGMGREDVITSIERHSTSKLQCIDDLERITSRGFRGEALASIVAISHVAITSAEWNADAPVCVATTLVAEGGKISSVIETHAPHGTTIEVTSLFFNVPARRKFLKSPAKDTQEVIKTVTCLALAAPHVAFRLIVDGRQVIGVAEEQDQPLNARIRALLKDSFYNDAFEVHHSRDGFSLTGLIADPRHARSTRSGQYIIVNGRSVFSLPISYAVKAAFGTTCEEGKHPLFALHLSLDPSTLDVNVHPQKREVRFADEEWVRMLVQESVSEALFGKRGFSSSCGFSMPSSASPSVAEPSEDPFSAWRYAEVEEQPVLPLVLPYSSGPSSAPLCLAVMGDIALIQPPRKSDPPLPIPHDALLLLDLRQAMRTVVFQDFENTSQQPRTELFLVPIAFDCSSQEASLIIHNIPHLEKMGFVLRLIGPQTFLIEGAAKPFLDLDMPKFLIDISYEGVFSSCDTVQELRNKRLATSYVATMKALHPPIEPEIALTILSSWSQHGFPALSPDGHPCFSQLTSSSLKEWIAKGVLTHNKNKRGTKDG
jgi:DNA mismatch repair protein MutL